MDKVRRNGMHLLSTSPHVQNAHNGEEDQPNGGNNSVGCNIGPSAHGNDNSKVNKHKIV